MKKLGELLRNERKKERYNILCLFFMISIRSCETDPFLKGTIHVDLPTIRSDVLEKNDRDDRWSFIKFVQN